MLSAPCYNLGCPVPTYLDRDIANDGQDSLSGSSVIYAVVHISSVGVEARPIEGGGDRYLRLGWFAFGDNLNVIGSVSRDYWREPVFLNYLDTLWTPDPSTASGSPLVLIGSIIRWHLGVGGAGHIFVFGA